jgi:dihydroorotate dehydrogenase (fumarate)
MDEEGRPVIGMGYAGLSGEAMKPVGLGQVRQLRERLKGAVEIVGLGGVLTGRDIADYLQPEVGAKAVAATTAYWRRGENPSVYGDMLSDYVSQFPEGG